MKVTEQQHNERKQEIMEKCFECYAENGLTGTGIKALAAACGCTTGNLYSYFSSVDELIIESTAYCMSKVEDEFMEIAPTDPKDVARFVGEVPYWTAKRHGKKYRLMYQVRSRNGSTPTSPNITYSRIHRSVVISAAKCRPPVNPTRRSGRFSPLPRFLHLSANSS